MKIIVKNKECCRIKKTWINLELSDKAEAARLLMRFFNDVNIANNDGVTLLSKTELAEELSEYGKHIIFEVSRSTLYFALPDVFAEAAEQYFVIVVHGINYYIPDNLTPENMLKMAISLVNSGDQIVEIEND